MKIKILGGGAQSVYILLRQSVILLGQLVKILRQSLILLRQSVLLEVEFVQTHNIEMVLQFSIFIQDTIAYITEILSHSKLY
jgi:hypothetical protein